MHPRLVINSLWCVVVASLVREMGELKMERLTAASTSATDRMLGQVQRVLVASILATSGQTCIFDLEFLHVQTWSEQAKHTSDILAGIQQLSSREYTEAAQQAKAHLMEFQHQQRPRMAFPDFAPWV